MLNTLEVRMVELPENGVLPLVTHHTRCLCVPSNGWCTTEAVDEASVGGNTRTLEGSGHFYDLEVFGMNRKRNVSRADSREFLCSSPLRSHPFGDVGRTSQGSIASADKQEYQNDE